MTRRDEIIRDGGKGFLDALEANRYDQTARLVFADWLEEKGFDDEALEQRRMATDEWCEDDQWLRVYAAEWSPYDNAETAFVNLLDGLKTGEIFYHGRDLHSLYELEDADELKTRAERYLRIGIDWSRFDFHCSC